MRFYKFASYASTAILLLSMGYIVGHIYPSITLSEKWGTALTRAEFYNLLIQIIIAFVTGLAVIVALLKEDLLKIFYHPDVLFSPANDFEEKRNEYASTSNPGSTVIECSEYSNSPYITNKGNVAAADIEVRLESVIFTSPQIVGPKNIPNIQDHLVITHSKLQPECKLHLKDLIQVVAPQSGPGGAGVQARSKLLVCGHDVSGTYRSGTWIASFFVTSTDHRLVRFTLKIEWNGEWKTRYADMDQLKISLSQ